MNVFIKIYGAILIVFLVILLNLYDKMIVLLPAQQNIKETTDFPYVEEVSVLVGMDTFYLTSLILNEYEEINTIYSSLTGSYIYTGAYEDVESLIFWLKEYPASDSDTFHLRYYYEEMIEEKIW